MDYLRELKFAIICQNYDVYECVPPAQPPTNSSHNPLLNSSYDAATSAYPPVPTLQLSSSGDRPAPPVGLGRFK
jgi:hypothetical protein